jgi:hypothetical protein
LIAETAAKDDAGKTAFARRAFLHLVAGRQKLYTSTSSFTDAELKKLTDERDSRLLSDAEYNEAVAKLFGGGAKEDSRPAQR